MHDLPMSSEWPSRRWRSLAERESPNGPAYWVAEVRRHAFTQREGCALLERHVYGPTREACLREAHRQDLIWAALPQSPADREKRAAFLAGGAA